MTVVMLTRKKCLAVIVTVVMPTKGGISEATIVEEALSTGIACSYKVLNCSLIAVS
jgi:hypothetical protein